MTSQPIKIAIALLAIAGVLASPDRAPAQTPPPGFQIENAFPSETFTLPVQLVFVPDGRRLVVEKEGQIWTVTAAGTKLPTPFIDLRAQVLSNDDRGLLGVALDPDFTTNRWVYLLYTVDPDSNGTDDNIPAYGRLERYQTSLANPNVADPATRQVLIGTNFATGVPQPARNRHHMVGTLRFGADKTLMVGSGDGANADVTDRGGTDPSFGGGLIDPSEDLGSFRARTLNSMDGKLLRVDKESGHGLSSNPYWDGNPTSDRSRVWVYGLRNPFRFAFRPGSGASNPSLGQPGVLYIGDVGWNATEEFDIARQGGLNFAWPCFEGPLAQSLYQGITSTATPNPNVLCPAPLSAENPVAGTGPALWWSHGAGGGANPPGLVGNCAIGGVFYTGTSYPAEFRDRYYLADFGAGWIKKIEVDANDNVLGVSDFIDGAGGVVDVEADPATGDLYYIDINTSTINRVRYGAGNLAPVVIASVNPQSGYPPLMVTVTASASTDPDGDPLSFLWAFGDGFTSTSANATHTYATEGQYTASVTVSDGRGGVTTRSFQVVVGQTAPPGVILRPSDRWFFSQDEVVVLEASPVDTTLGPATYRWDVDFGHDNHIHPSTEVYSGPIASFTAATPHDAEEYFFRIRLSVTQGALTSADTVHVYPKVNVTATAMSFIPPSPSTDAAFQVLVTVRSNGEVGSSLSSYQVLEGTNVLASGALAPILDGDSLVVTATVGPLGSGPHSLRVLIDPADDLVETDELDNEISRAVNVGRLVAGYALNEGTGATTADASGNGIAGTLNGATWTTAGRNGNALTFNGSSAYVELGNPGALQLTGSMTVSAWVNAAANPGDDGQLVAKSTDNVGWQLKTSPDTGPHTFGMAISGAGGRVQRYSTTVRALNTWYHVAGVYDAAAQQLNLYVNGALDNGVLVGTVPGAQTDAAVSVNLGRRPSGYHFNGRIDDVRIYDRALSATEIVADMNTAVGAGPPPPPPPPPLPPAVPVLASPANGATGVAGNPTLAWNAAAGAATYRVQVSTTVGFAVLVVDQGNLTGTTHGVSGLAASTEYYWRVNASNAGGTSAYSAVSSFTTAAAPPPPPPSSGLVAGYALNEGTGATTADASGNGIAGTLNGATWTTAGRNGNALTFNGSSAYVELGNPGALQLTGSMTVSAWVNAAANPGDDGQLVAKSTDNVGWQLKTSPDTGPHTFGMAISGAGGRVQRYSTTVRVLNTWYHVAGVYDAAAQQLNLYVNGALDNGVLVGTVPGAQTNAGVSVNLGRRPSGYHFNGRIDDVRIYSRALSATEIVADMNTAVGAGPPPPPPPPPPAPAAPVLASPANGTTGVAGNPTLAWNAATGATSYRVQVSTEVGFGSLVVDQGSLSGTTYAASGLAASTVYHWRVNATNGGGTSAYSTVWSFTTAAPLPSPAAPVLASPANGATGVAGNPTLAWNAATGATSYRVQVSTEVGFGSLVVDQGNLTGTTHGVSGLAASTEYYWRVNASNAGGTSAYSAVSSFTTAAAPPPPPPSSGLVAGYALNEGTGATTADASGNGIAGTLNGATWTTAGRNGNALTFNGSSAYVELGNPGALQLTGSMTVSAWVNAAANPGDDGQLVAKSTDNVGWQLKTSPDTGPHTFGMAISGAGGRVQRYSTTVRVLNTWYHVAGVYDAAAQQLNLYVNGALDNGVLVGTVPGAQTNAGVSVNLGRRPSGYHFNGRIDDVRIYSRALSATEIVADMNTAVGAGPPPPPPPPPPAPAAPVLASPANGTTGVAGNPTLAWNAATGATSYRVQVSTEVGFGSLVVDQGSLSGTTYAASGLAASTVYHWRVNATNGGGTSAYSTVWSFTTAAAPPPPPPSSGLVAGYALNEGTGTTAADASGNGLTGTLNGATWTTAGRNGNALTFNGSSAYVELGTPGALQLTGSMTVSAWVNAAANPGDDGQLVAKSTDNVGWQLKTSPDTGPHTFGIAISGAGGRVQRYSTTVRALNTWYHVAGVYDAAAQQLNLYVNGALDNGVLVGTVPGAQTNAGVSVNLGRRPSGYHFNGRIDDVRIYSRALSATEIVADMNTAVGSGPPPPPFTSFGIEGRDAAMPSFALELSSPNPVGASAGIVFTLRLPEAGRAKLEVFNVLGERVAVLVDEDRAGGSHVVRFDPGRLPSGVYLVRFTSGRFSAVRKIVRMR